MESLVVKNVLYLTLCLNWALSHYIHYNILLDEKYLYTHKTNMYKKRSMCRFIYWYHSNPISIYYKPTLHYWLMIRVRHRYVVLTLLWLKEVMDHISYYFFCKLYRQHVYTYLSLFVLLEYFFILFNISDLTIHNHLPTQWVQKYVTVQTRIVGLAAWLPWQPQTLSPRMWPQERIESF